jgi:arylsulfatase
MATEKRNAVAADHGMDAIARDTGSPASPDYGPTGNRFSGEIHWPQIELGEDDHNHLITPEHRFNLAMARE